MHRGGHEESSPGPVRPLKRGKACLTCRFLKIKCDGTRPICGPCNKHPKDDPCEYADGPGRSRTKALEDKISRLEARIQELEDPERATPSVMLHHPYDESPMSGLQLTMPSASTSTSPYTTPDRHSYSPLSPFPASSPPSTTSTSSPMGLGLLSPLSESKPAFLENEDLPQPLIRELLNNFIMHASEFGFFLNISRFHNNALLPLNWGHPARPAPALLRTVYLWGASLSSSESQRGREPDFLLRSLADTSISLTTDHPLKILHTIQAEVLLAYYFFRSGRYLEAKVHANGAASLAMGCGLHKLRSQIRWTAPMISLSGKDPIYLSEARDALEEGERINGFWAIVTLLKTLPLAYETPQNVCGVLEAPGVQIDTPWPLDMESYKEGTLPNPSSSTIQNFLTPRQTDEYAAPLSVSALVAKAAVLFHRATYLAGQYTPNFPDDQKKTFYSAYEFLTRALDNFRLSLPDTLELNPSIQSTRMLCLSHALTYGGMIKLYELFANSSGGPRQSWLNAARAMLRYSTLGYRDSSELRNVSPIMGTLWYIACDVFIQQLEMVQELRLAGLPSNEDMSESDLHSDLNTGLAALKYFATESALMSKSSQLRKVLYQMSTSPISYPAYYPPSESATPEIYSNSKMEDYESEPLDLYQWTQDYPIPIALLA